MQIDAAIQKAIRDAVAEENSRWGGDGISVEVKLVGDRPAGVQSLDTPIVHAALLATRAVGLQPVLEEAASTDSNLPISLGIPALTIGRGGKTDNRQ